MANSNSYLGLASGAEELNVGENSQTELDESRAGFSTSELRNKVKPINKYTTIDFLNKNLVFFQTKDKDFME